MIFWRNRTAEPGSDKQVIGRTAGARSPRETSVVAMSRTGPRRPGTDAALLAEKVGGMEPFRPGKVRRIVRTAAIHRTFRKTCCERVDESEPEGGEKHGDFISSFRG